MSTIRTRSLVLEATARTGLAAAKAGTTATVSGPVAQLAAIAVALPTTVALVARRPSDSVLTGQTPSPLMVGVVSSTARAARGRNAVLRAVTAAALGRNIADQDVSPTAASVTRQAISQPTDPVAQTAGRAWARGLATVAQLAATVGRQPITVVLGGECSCFHSCDSNL